jgi:hypothetical protein
LKSGAVVCWGDNFGGALGQDQATISSSAAPVAVPGVNGAIDVTMSGDATSACATLTDHSLVCWGGGVVPPVAIGGVSNVAKVGLGEQFSCARQANNKILCWGKNNLGQCGSGVTAPAIVATPTDTMVGGFDIVAGRQHACTRDAANGVVCWGDVSFGQQGPGAVAPGPTFLSLQATMLGHGRYHTCARLTDGTVSCWGMISSTQPPTLIPGLMNPIQLSGGSDYHCALATPTVVTCWGQNATPVPVKW